MLYRWHYALMYCIDSLCRSVCALGVHCGGICQLSVEILLWLNPLRLAYLCSVPSPGFSGRLTGSSLAMVGPYGAAVSCSPERCMHPCMPHGIRLRVADPVMWLVLPNDRSSYSLWAAVFCPIKCGGQVAVLGACPVFRFCAPAQEGAHTSQLPSTSPRSHQQIRSLKRHQSSREGRARAV